jgi:hypothetical protein
MVNVKNAQFVRHQIHSLPQEPIPHAKQKLITQHACKQLAIGQHKSNHQLASATLVDLAKDHMVVQRALKIQTMYNV